MAERRKRKRHDRTPTQHGALVMCWLKDGKRLTTTQLASRLGLSPQGALRIMRILEAEREFAVYQDELSREWLLLENGEPVTK